MYSWSCSCVEKPTVYRSAQSQSCLSDLSRLHKHWSDRNTIRQTDFRVSVVTWVFPLSITGDRMLRLFLVNTDMAPVQGPSTPNGSDYWSQFCYCTYRKIAAVKTVKRKHRLSVHHIIQRRQTAVFIVTLLMSAWRHLHYSYTTVYPRPRPLTHESSRNSQDKLWQSIL